MSGMPLETCYYKLHLVGISTESYYDARIHEYQTKSITNKQKKLHFLSVTVVFDSQFLTSVSFHLQPLQMNKLGTILQYVVYISVSMIQKPSKLRFRKYTQKTFPLCSVVPRIDREMCIPCCTYRKK